MVVIDSLQHDEKLIKKEEEKNNNNNGNNLPIMDYVNFETFVII